MPIASRFGGNSLRAFGQRGTTLLKDLYFKYVSLLLSSTSLGNATNNLFVDSSSAFSPITRNGNPTQGSFSPFGSNWSNYFDGSGDYLSLPSASGSLGTNDFTIECWYRSTTPTASTHCPIIAQYEANAQGSWALKASSGNDQCLQFAYYNSGWFDHTTTTNITSDMLWHHVAATRSGTTLRIYADGVLVKTVSMGTVSLGGTGYTLQIGRIANDNAFMTGFVSNVRIINGTALYTGSTYTVPTSPLTAVSGTQVLTCQSNRFIDNSSNAFTITRNGDVSVSKFGPFAAAAALAYDQSDVSKWSGYFDGTSNAYITFPNAAQLDLPSNQSFTIEGWIYPTRPNNGSQSGFRNIVSKRVATSLTSNYNIMLNYNSEKIIFYNGSVISTSTASIPQNAWTHFAYVYDGASSLKLYINGTLDSTFSTAPGATNSAPVTIGSMIDDTGTYDNFGGNISDIRIVKGSQVYTSNFTVPSSSLTAINGTSLLTCQNAAFTDQSSYKALSTVYANPTVTGNSPYQTNWSNYFDGSGDYLTLPSSTAFDLGSGDFTIEFWMNTSPSQSSDSRPLGNWNNDGWAANKWSVHINHSSPSTPNQVAFWVYNILGTTTQLLLSTSTVNGKGWVHVAIVRSGTSFAMFINGTREATATQSGSVTNGATPVFVGGTAAAGEQVNGYLSNVRIVKGTAVYNPASSTIAVPTTSLTAVSGTSLLTCQSNKLVDNSSNAFTVTKNGDSIVHPFNPFYTSTVTMNGGSGYFDGDGDNLTLADNTLFEFGGGEFSIDCWVQLTSLKGYQAFVSKNTGTDYYGYNLYIESNNTIGFIAGNGSWTIALNGSFVPTVGQWYHLAITRQSNQWRLFINGNLNATTNNSFSIPDLSCPLYIGKYPAFPAYSSTKDLSGYMSELRIVKGGVPSLFNTASTTTGTQVFTPPTTRYTGSESLTSGALSLLMHFGNAGAYDSTGLNNLETVGDTKVGTVQSKFGGASMYFDGSGDSGRIAVNQLALQFGTSNFTAEGWVYSTGGTGTYQHILTGGTSWTTGSGGIYWYYNSGSPTLGAAWNQIATNPAVNSGTLSINTWYHFALVRNGNTMTLYINGTSVSSISVTGVSLAFNNQSRTNIGGGGWDQDFAGYIDDLRVTAGVARYTANFSPPAKTLPLF